jgi:hypothetical protein
MVGLDARLTYAAATLMPTRYADVMRRAAPLARAALQRRGPVRDRNLG